ncbi:unnamed protein product [Lathyrus oleraceus]
MVKFLIFVYAIILCFCLFIVATKVGGEIIQCETDSDCLEAWIKYYVHKCIDYKCKWIIKSP